MCYRRTAEAALILWCTLGRNPISNAKGHTKRFRLGPDMLYQASKECDEEQEHSSIGTRNAIRVVMSLLQQSSGWKESTSNQSMTLVAKKFEGSTQ